jgi:uncharacterized protein (TIGR00251 family)
VAARALITPEPGGIVLAVKAAPKSSRDAILGVMDTPQGPALKVAVTAAPDRGKANAAVIELIANAFGVPKSAVTVIAGATDRSKLLRVAGEPAALARTAAQWKQTKK